MDVDNILINKKILDQIATKEGFTFNFSYPDMKVLTVVNGLTSHLLGNIDKIYLLNPLITILRECILNAIKANSKRLFFQINNADISNEEQYNKIMEKFHSSVVGDFSSIQKNLIESKYKVHINYARKETSLQITIKNNTAILPKEQKRITERYNNAQKYNDFSEAYENMYDETEGAGLGIILTVMLLKNAGIPSNNFSISSDGKNTYTRILIPSQLKPEKVTTRIKKQILSEIDILPTFPQNIIDLQQMCEQKDASIDAISDKIQADSSLSADLLKLANSAGFAAAQRIDTIHDALMRIGLSNLSHVLLAASSKKIMDKRYTKFEGIWNHCFQAGFYTRQIVKKTKNAKAAELGFVAGLLHDIGKIVLLSVDLDVTNWISDFVKHRQIRTTTLLEEVSIGISHSAIGLLIADKWNFAEFLKDAIFNHHSPLNSKDEHRDVVYATYLANQFCGIEARKYEYAFINQDVKKHFNLLDENKCMNLHKDIQAAFDLQKNIH